MEKRFSSRWCAYALMGALILSGCPTPTSGDGGSSPTTPNAAPVISWSFDTRVDPNVSTDFSASGTTDDGSIVSYSWDFGDGNSATGENVSHTYTASEEYTLTLTVTDDAGKSATKTGTILVTNLPTAAIVVTPGTSINISGYSGGNDKVSFDGSSSSDADGTIASYEWDMDDGTILTGSSITDYQYTNGGAYTVELTVTDDLGATDTASVVITVSNPDNQAPVIDSLTVPLTGQTGIQVSFSASASDDLAVESYSWDFGDGSSGTGSTATHNYTAAGDYTVTLTVTDIDGATDSDSAVIAIDAPPAASFVYDSTDYYDRNLTGTSLDFDASASTDNSSIASWEWDFGDTASGSGETISHSYTAAGTYTVTLTVTDDNGLTDSTSISLTVTDNPLPAADAGEDQTLDYDTDGSLISLDGSGSSDDVAGMTYAWTFTGVPSGSNITDSDLSNATAESPTFDINGDTAATAGASGFLEYELQLTVTDYDGETDTDRVMVFVSGTGSVNVQID